MQIERRRAERRQPEPKQDAELSPEYLALLEVCGGEIRASDRVALAERREAARSEAEAQAAQAQGGKDVAEQAAALAASDRRRGGTG
jgi:hypothetical protein